MKKLFDFILSLFKKKDKKKVIIPIKPNKTVEIMDSGVIHSFNVNGTSLEISNVCSTGVITLFSKCERLDFGCVVYNNQECTDYTSLIGTYFHDYSNDIVYQVQEDGSIINLGKCN